jgi:integrase
VPRPALPPGDHGTVGLRKLDDGRWLASVYVRDATGARRRVTARRTTGPAARAAVLATAGAITPASAGPLTGQTRWRDAASMWLTDRRERVAATTHDKYQQWARVIDGEIGDLRLAEVTPGRLRVAFERLAPGRGVSTLRSYLVVVSSVLRFAAAHDAGPGSDVARGVVQGRRASRAPSALTVAEASALVAALRQQRPAWVADFVLVQVATGLRFGEMLALRVRDYRPDANALDVTGNLVTPIGRGIVRHAGKTAAALRSLPLPAFVAPTLAELVAGREPDAPLFPNRSGQWLRPNTAHVYFRRALDAAGYPGTKPHELRRTAASILDDAGVPARAIADQLGHASIRTTQQSYLGRRRDGGRAAAALDAAFGRDQR